MDGEEDLRHPRAVAAFRVALWLVVATALFVVAVASMGVLGVLAIVVGTLAAVGQGGLLGVGWLALAGVALVGATAVGSVVGARRLERRVVDADRRPDPVAVAKERYVRDDIDEVELEAQLERVLDDSGDGRSTAGRPTAGWSGSDGRRVRRERERGRDRAWDRER